MKNYSKKGLLTLAIALAVASSVSAQTTDTISFLGKIIVIDDVNTNREYYQAILSLVHEDLKNNPTNEFLIEIQSMYLSLISKNTEMHNIGPLSDKADEIEIKYQQLLINNPKKVQFHINNGKKYSKGDESTLEPESENDYIYPDQKPKSKSTNERRN